MGARVALGLGEHELPADAVFVHRPAVVLGEGIGVQGHEDLAVLGDDLPQLVEVLARLVICGGVEVDQEGVRGGELRGIAHVEEGDALVGDHDLGGDYVARGAGESLGPAHEVEDLGVGVVGEGVGVEVCGFLGGSVLAEAWDDVDAHGFEGTRVESAVEGCLLYRIPK